MAKSGVKVVCNGPVPLAGTYWRYLTVVFTTDEDGLHRTKRMCSAWFEKIRECVTEIVLRNQPLSVAVSTLHGSWVPDYVTINVELTTRVSEETSLVETGDIRSDLSEHEGTLAQAT